MNGFRITILTLLCLSVGLMFYAVLFVIPSWQGNYDAYQSSLKLAAYEKKSDIHRQQMMAYDPEVEAPEVERARLEQEAAARRDEATINEAEENNVVAAAKRKEEAARVRAVQQKEEAASPHSAVIGQVASFDPEWNCVMIRPSVPELFQPGAVLAVRREGVVLCELVVDSRDAESGQVSATRKETDITTEAADAKKLEPTPGDEVIVSPFKSAKELLGESPGAAPIQPLPGTPSSDADDHVPPPLPPPPPSDAPESPASPSVDTPAHASTPVAPARSSDELPSLDDTINTLEQ